MVLAAGLSPATVDLGNPCAGNCATRAKIGTPGRTLTCIVPLRRRLPGLFGHGSVFTKMTGENLAIKLAESFTEKNSKLAELRVIVEACPVATFISNQQGECLYVNRAYQDLVGRPYRACLETRWKAFVYPDDLDAALAAWLRCVETEQPYDYQYRDSTAGRRNDPRACAGGAAAQRRLRRLHQRHKRGQLPVHLLCSASA
jgi:PAS domain-containing protein